MRNERKINTLPVIGRAYVRTYTHARPLEARLRSLARARDRFDTHDEWSFRPNQFPVAGVSCVRFFYRRGRGTRVKKRSSLAEVARRCSVTVAGSFLPLRATPEQSRAERASAARNLFVDHVNARD